MFFFSSSDRLVQNCGTLSWWFSHKTVASFYTKQCTSPSLFHNFEVSWGGLTHAVTEELWLCLWCHFLHLYACAQIIKQQNAIVTRDCWIRIYIVLCMKTWRVFVIHCWLSVWLEPGQLILQPILHTSTEEACEDRLAAMHLLLKRCSMTWTRL